MRFTISSLPTRAAGRGSQARWPDERDTGTSTFARTRPDRARELGIVNPARVRQWDLDLAMLGTATVARRPVAAALGVGAWTNAMLFLPLAVKPEVDQGTPFKAAAVGSFLATSAGFTGMAATAVARRRRRR